MLPVLSLILALPRLIHHLVAEVRLVCGVSLYCLGMLL